jgi:hypothetical protein
MPETGLAADFDGNGEVSAHDLFLLASRWHGGTGEAGRYVIFARAWAKGTTGEAFSTGDVVVPLEYPANQEGLLKVLQQWPED